MKNAQRPSRAQSLIRSLFVYASYWYMIGPAFAVSLQLYLNYRFGLVKLIGDATFPDVINVFSCIVLLGYIGATFFITFRQWRDLIIFGSAVCGVLAMLGTELPGILGVGPGIWAIASMLLFSLFFMSQLLLWFRVFACHDSMINLIYILILSALSGCFCWFLIGLSGARLLCALIVVVIFAAATLHKSLRSTSELNAPQTDKRSQAKPPIGLLVITFFFGLGFMYTTSFMSLEDFHNVFDWANYIYALILCVTVIIFSHRIRISTLYYIAAPITIAGILLTLFSNPLTSVPSMLSNAGFFTFLVFVLVLYCAISHEQNSEPVRASCFLILCLYAGLLAGRRLFSMVDALLDAETASFFHPLIAVFIIILLVICTMIGMRIVSRVVSTELSRPQFTHITDYKSSEFSTHIAAVFKLSDREREVLSLLLENKSATEIADVMVIAHGTVKTHINNIYKKLNIHSREELFAMVPGGELASD